MIIYLYVKQHMKTGLKYFGVTRKTNPYKYTGSGKYWQRHIATHGREYVKTVDVWGFDDPKMCRDFALAFSQENNIVDSEDWANLIIEDTIIRYNGGSEKHSESSRKMWANPDYREKQTTSHRKAWLNEEHRTEQSAARKANWQDPEYRQRTIAAGKASRKDPKYLENQRLKSKAKWDDPAYRQAREEKRALAPKRIWINNGSESKTWPINTPLPGNDWMKGRIKRP